MIGWLLVDSGDERIRTAGLFDANEALYQLSYTPAREKKREWAILDLNQ